MAASYGGDPSVRLCLTNTLGGFTDAAHYNRIGKLNRPERQNRMLRTDAPFVGSFAMLRRQTGDVEQWLTIWDPVRNVFRLIEATRGSDSFRTCLHEAIEDELELDRNDYLISGYSAAHHQAPIEWPDAAVPQWVVVEFFPVDLYGSQSAAKVERMEHTRWFSLSEIARGRTAEGDVFCQLQRQLIHRAQILPPEFHEILSEHA